MDKKENSDDILRNICDKRSLEAINFIESVNKERGDRIKQSVIRYFQQTNKFITYDEYIKIVSTENKETKIKIERKTNPYDLADIDDL